MSVIPTVSQDGVGVVAAGQLNAYTFSCYNTGVLRTIVGQTGMTAYLQGTNVPADGGQGIFYWNYASTASDDNVNTIVPAGVVYGAWIRLTLAVASGGTGTTTSTGTGSVVLNNSPTITGTLNATSINASGTISIGSNLAVNGPAVSVYLSSNQSATTATWTKVTLNSEEFDTANSFNSTTTYRFQPLTPGYYQCDATLGATVTSGTQGSCAFYKNGTIYKNGSGVTGSFTVISMVANAVIFLNGTTDYVELWGNVTGTTPSFTGSQNATSFSASMIRGQ
jgi:hypothetical protein